MNDIAPHKQRYAETAFLKSQALESVGGGGVVDVHKRPHIALLYHFGKVCAPLVAVLICPLVELTDFLLKRHAPQKVLYPLLYRSVSLPVNGLSDHRPHRQHGGD